MEVFRILVMRVVVVVVMPHKSQYKHNCKHIHIVSRFCTNLTYLLIDQTRKFKCMRFCESIICRRCHIAQNPHYKQTQPFIAKETDIIPGSCCTHLPLSQLSFRFSCSAKRYVCMHVPLTCASVEKQ